jgi:hypothetical protein
MHTKIGLEYSAVADCLPSKPEALGLIPSTKKRKDRKNALKNKCRGLVDWLK